MAKAKIARQSAPWIIEFTPRQIEVLREILNNCVDGMIPCSIGKDHDALANRIALADVKDILDAINEVTG